MLLICLLVIAALSVAALLGRRPYFELATHFRLQYAIGATACVVFFALERSWKLSVAAMCLAAVSWSYILPWYSSPAREQSALASTRLVVMLANVEGNNTHYAMLVGAVREAHADVVVLQEVTDEWWRNIEALRSEYPYFKALPAHGGSGLALFSRFPRAQADFLTPDQSTHPALFARIDPVGAGGPLPVCPDYSPADADACGEVCLS